MTRCCINTHWMGARDAITGDVDLQFSLRHLMAECTDFTALQHLGTQLGVRVQLTPKFHAELAGEGVEYSWALAKSFYCCVPVSRKRGWENFKQLVRECTCPVNVLSKVRIEKLLCITGKSIHVCLPPS
jgi:hypothetical protein